tara:strand:+ start:422 stop:616 length:195 start_codon:yes stop_codon:yes gene_type:complete
MNFESVTYVYSGVSDDTPVSIKAGFVAVVNGKTIHVPLREGNRHYQAIQEWAAIDGNNIIDNGA